MLYQIRNTVKLRFSAMLVLIHEQDSLYPQMHAAS